MSSSLPKHHRDAIASFASKKNKALLKFPAYSVRSLHALGLLITCIYTELKATKEQQQQLQQQQQMNPMDDALPGENEK